MEIESLLLLVWPSSFSLCVVKSTRISPSQLKQNCTFKAHLAPLLKNQKIRKDLSFIEDLNANFCATQGTNYFTSGQAIVYVSPGFYQTDKNACIWAIKHEICHIKNNDCFKIHLTAAICSVFAAAATSFFLQVIPAYILTGAVGITAQAIFSQYCEKRADQFAIQTSTSDELLGARRLFIALAEANRSQSKFTISSTGEDKLNFYYPSINSRLSGIEDALKANNISIIDCEENSKIANLKEYLIETQLKIEKLNKE